MGGEPIMIPTIDGLQFDDLPGPLGSDSDVDGVLWLDDGKVRHPIPFGRTVPADGATGKEYGVWSWNGDREEPTLTPSVNLADFHVSIRGGEVIP